MKKIRVKRIIILIILMCLLLVSAFSFYKHLGSKESVPKDTSKQEAIRNLKGYSLTNAIKYLDDNKIKYDITYEYSEDVLKDNVIKSTYDEKMSLVVSLGKIDYNSLLVNELGNIPIMMYHGIVNITDNKYTGGNVDKDGYNRTVKAFREDLEFYYSNGYRMIRLDDYIKGIIKVELGKSPIILTFDDGNQNNINVLGKNSDGKLIIDPNSAVGVLEEFKKKYADFNVTATFFLNAGLFNQKEYNQEIINYLLDNGYDIGNHTTTHGDLSKISKDETTKIIGAMYKSLDEVTSGKYVKIIALPFGSPYKKSHANYSAVLEGNYNGYAYKTDGALRVGWESEVSPFASGFDATFLKRCRAYDNNGKEFDIDMVFKSLKNNRYVSDGNVEKIVIKEGTEGKLGNTYEREVIYY